MTPVAYSAANLWWSLAFLQDNGVSGYFCMVVYVSCIEIGAKVSFPAAGSPCKWRSLE